MSNIYVWYSLWLRAWQPMAFWVSYEWPWISPISSSQRGSALWWLKKTFYLNIAWVRVSVLLLTNCVILGKLLTWPLPQFSHPQNKNNNSTYLLSLLWILNKLTHKKCLKMSMAYSKSSVSVNHHYLEERARTLGVRRIKDILVERIGTYKVTVVWKYKKC